MKKIPPKLKPDKPITRRFYGSNSNVGSLANSLKTNYICPNYRCNFTARRYIFETFKINYSSTHHCPKCKEKLVNFGNACKLPKVGSNERKYWIERYIKWEKETGRRL